MTDKSKQYSGYAGTVITYPRASRKTEDQPLTRQQTRQQTIDDGENEDAWTVEKPHTSAYRYDYPVTPPHNATRDMSNPKRTQLIKQRRFDHWTLITLLCLAIIVMVVGWFLFSKIADWWTNTSDDWKYGNPRTFQTDQFVGQGDSPAIPDHFIVVNMVVNTHGQVIVIQLNPQHPQLDHIYGITTVSDPKTPVSLSFRPTGNTWAMYVIVGDTNPYSVEYISNGKQFVSASS